MNKYKKRRLFLLVLSIVLILSILIVLLLSRKKDNFKAQSVDLSFFQKNENNKVECSNCLELGWIQVQGTNINYPVMNRELDELDNETSHGWISPYSSSEIKNTIILGHNVLNVSNSPSRDMSKLVNFEGLMAFTYYDFAKENLYVSYIKDGVENIYKIFAAGFNDYTDTFEPELYEENGNIKNYIDTVLDKSIYDYSVDVNENDEFITIKTCTRYFGVEENQEFRIVARKVRKDEKIETYQVKKNNNYKELLEK